jgi:nucleotide-binding universal stress UspA family protein
MTSSQGLWKRALWAVDPFARHAEIQRSALQVFFVLAGDRSVVEPVYLVNVHPESESTLSAIKKQAFDKYHGLVEPTQSRGLLPLKIITSRQPMRRSEVETLIDYAKESGANLIIVSTRASSGAYRWLVGSFTDTLMLFSDVPLLVVSPTCKAKPEIEEVVFPTDFSPESRRAFERACKLAKDLGHGVTVFHKIPSTNSTLFYTDLVASPMYHVTYREQAEFAEAQSKAWVEFAQLEGVPAQAVIRTACTQSAADVILNYTEGRKCLIAMAAKSGPISRALLGGTTRRVVRGATVPVWVVHP